VLRFALFSIASLALRLNMGMVVCLAADEPKPLQLIVSLAPGELPVAEIRIPLALDAKEGTRQIFVHNVDAEVTVPLAGVRFYVQLRDENGVPIGTVSATGEKPAMTEVAIPAKGRSVAIQLQITGIERFGKFSGPLIATLDNQAVTLATVQVVRIAKPRLELLDAPSGDGAITLKTDLPKITRSIRIRASDDSPVKINSFALLPFLATNAGQVPPEKVSLGEEGGKEFDLKQPLAPGKSAALSFSAQFDEVATYSGVLRIEYEGGTLQRSITITRERPPPAFEILGSETLYGTHCWLGSLIIWRFSVHETGGKPRQLNVPVLLNFGLDEESQKGQTNYQDPVFLDGQTAITNPWQLTQGDIKPLTMELRGVSSGRYAGIVQIGQADGQSKPKDIKVLVKEAWPVPAICIIVGVMLSTFLRLAVNRWWPQLERSRRSSELSEELTRIEKAAEPADAHEQTVLASFRDRWSTMNRCIEDSKFAEADTIDVELGKKVAVFPEWLNTYRRWNAVVPPEIVEGLHARLEGVREALLGAVVDADFVSKHRDELEKISQEITDKIAANLRESLGKFEKQVIARSNPASAPADQRSWLAKEVLSHVSLAREALGQDNLEIYRREFAKARGEFVQFLVKELRDKLALEERPIGFQSKEFEPYWTALKEEVEPLLQRASQQAVTNPDEADKTYQEAYARYLHRLIGRAQKVLAEAKKVAQDNAQRLGPEKTKEHQKTVMDLENKLLDATNELNSGDPKKAAETYQAAADDISALVEVLKPSRQVQLGKKGEVAETERPLTGAEVGQTVAAPASESMARVIAGFWSPRRLSMKQIVFYRDVLEGVLAVATMVIAVLLGLKLLWAGDATWGSCDDWLTAVLWGLGLHQVSGAAIGGSQGLLDRFLAAEGKK
jgi:hypothetical protein